MKSDFAYTDSSSIYPGAYVPLFKENDLCEAVKYANENKATGLPVNINESRDFYKVELAIPGVERENLLVKVCGNILSISVIYNKSVLAEQKQFQLHEFTLDGGFSRKVILPYNADPVFISAEYRSGILQLHVPKSLHPVKRIDAKIAVY